MTSSWQSWVGVEFFFEFLGFGGFLGVFGKVLIFFKVFLWALKQFEVRRSLFGRVREEKFVIFMKGLVSVSMRFEEIHDSFFSL